MIDMDALLRGLPVSGLEPQPVARLDGLVQPPEEYEETTPFTQWPSVLWLLEPPAGRHVPYLDPRHALYALLRAGGAAHSDACAQALNAAAILRQEAAAAPWFTSFDRWNADSPECLPAPDFLHWLRHSEQGRALRLLPASLDMLEDASEAALDTVFTSEEYPGQHFTLKTLPELPLPKSMIEFAPYPFWVEENYIENADAWLNSKHPFFRWREDRLDDGDWFWNILDTHAYDGAELDNEFYDDCAHRFLVLHWCCTERPQSAFIKYLVKISGAGNVEELKAALIEPDNYRQHPFEINSFGAGTLKTRRIPSFLWNQQHGSYTHSEGTPENALRCHRGQLLGNKEALLLPCFYLARRSASRRELERRKSKSKSGFFSLGNCVGRCAAAQIGLVFPLALCKDEKIRAALVDISAIVQDNTSTMEQKRHDVQHALDAVFGGNIQLAAREEMDGFFALEQSPALYHCLRERFSYVAEVFDNPASVANITATSRFDWDSFAAFEEQHCIHGSHHRGTFVPFFVVEPSRALSLYPWTRANIGQPRGDVPANAAAPVIPDTHVKVRLEMGEAGWAYLHLSLGDANGKVWFSEVWEPFDDFIAWCREIDEGEVPVQFKVDEEGTIAVLTALETNEPAWVLLRVTRKDDWEDEEKEDEKVLLEGIISRASLAAALKNELRRFFTEDLNPQEWDVPFYNPEDYDGGYVHLHERIQGNWWLWGKGGNGYARQPD